MEKVLEISLLYDLYGQMLTDKQRDIIDLHYNNDYSLSEISEITGVSRQGVYDILKRSEKLLYQYEDKLHLVERLMDGRKKLEEAYSLLNDISDTGKLKKVKAILKDVIDNNF